jgi:ferredoxin
MRAIFAAAVPETASKSQPVPKKANVMPLAKSEKTPAQLETELRAIAEKAGVDLVGVADVSSVYEVFEKMSKKPVKEEDAWPRAISIACAFKTEIVDDIPKITPAYGRHMYKEIWPAARKARDIIAKWLKKEGFKVSNVSKGLPGGGVKIAARYSGLAWIGKSCLAVSPQFGPRVIWEVVYTDAPLIPSGKPRERECGDCQRCIDVCPVKAYTGIPFDEKENPKNRFDTSKCGKYRTKLGMYETGACGLCLEICPYGKRSDILLAEKPVVPILPKEITTGPGNKENKEK